MPTVPVVKSGWSWSLIEELVVMWRSGSGLVVAFLLGVVSACGGSGDTNSSTDTVSGGSQAVGGEMWSVAEVAPSVEFFGDLAVVRSAPVTATFDASAASLELDDGVIVDVPAGAFDAPTEVTAVIVDLDFAQYADNAPPAAAYVLSTEADVDLATPVVLEVPGPPDTVSVLRPIDGEWRLVEVPAGPTTRIPITHFSEVPTVVAEPGISSAVIKGSDPDGEVPGDFLTACLYTVTTLLADDIDAAGGQDITLSLPLAYSFCTRALVTKFSPSGVRVEVSCVGDKIGGDVDFLAAINACAAETDSAQSDDEQDDDSAPPPGDDNVATEPAAAEDEGGDEAVAGSFSGSIDFVGYFEAVDPMIAGNLTITTNEMVVVIEGDQVTSITGTGIISWPEIEAGNNTTICASDTTWTISAEVPVSLDVDRGFTASGFSTVVGTSTCSGGGSPNSDAIDDRDPVTIVGTLTGGGSQIDIRFDFEGVPIGLTALLTAS